MIFGRKKRRAPEPEAVPVNVATAEEPMRQTPTEPKTQKLFEVNVTVYPKSGPMQNHTYNVLALSVGDAVARVMRKDFEESQDNVEVRAWFQTVPTILAV